MSYPPSTDETGESRQDGGSKRLETAARSEKRQAVDAGRVRGRMGALEVSSILRVV